MENDYGTEAEVSGWDFGDDPKQVLSDSTSLNEFGKMLEFHEIDETDWIDLGENEKARHWSAFYPYRNNLSNGCIDKISLMKSRYQQNKNKEVGEKIECAFCGKSIIKQSYQTQFCRNKGAGNHKDRYWNTVSEKRRRRAKTICMLRRN